MKHETDAPETILKKELKMILRWFKLSVVTVVLVTGGLAALFYHHVNEMSSAVSYTHTLEVQLDDTNRSLQKYQTIEGKPSSSAAVKK